MTEDVGKKRVDALRNATEIQCSDGNWNFDPYMFGMANGLIFALATLEGRTPKYLDAPKRWLCSKESPVAFPPPSIMTDAVGTPVDGLSVVVSLEGLRVALYGEEGARGEIKWVDEHGDCWVLFENEEREGAIPTPPSELVVAPQNPDDDHDDAEEDDDDAT